MALPAMRSSRLPLSGAGEACQDGTEDEGHHQHLDGVDEQDADGFEQQGLLAEAESRPYPGQHAEQVSTRAGDGSRSARVCKDQSMEQHDGPYFCLVAKGATV